MIYVNGRFLTQPVTGVQRFAIELSKELIKLRDDVVFLVPNKKIVSFDGVDDFNIQILGGGAGHYWEQVTLPFFLGKKTKPLLINLCSTAPIFYDNQIVTHHDITYVKYPESFSLCFRLLYRYLIPKILKNSKKIITVSEFSKSEISKHYSISKQKIIVVNNAVSDKFISNKNVENKSHESYILAVSSPNYHKNFHGLIEAFLETNINIKLKIIGGGAASFNKVNYNLGSDKRVEFLGRVDDDELVNLYSSAKFFVFPSFYEGFGIPPLEAQACGCPVISSNKASMPEVLNKSVLYFSPTSKNEIIAAIKLINEKDELRADIRAMGFENVKKYSWPMSAFKLNKIINDVGN